MRSAVLSLLMTAAAITAHAQAATVRKGDHAGFSRLVYEFGEDTTWRAEGSNHSLIIIFDHPLEIPPVPQLPRNFSTIEVGSNTLHIVADPQARLRVMRIGRRLVLDALDPPPGKAPNPQSPKPTPLQVVQSPPIDRHDAPLPSPAQAAVPPPQPRNVTETSFALRAVPAASSHHTTDIRLPFGPEVGAAAFRNSQGALIVFDVERPIDLSEMKQRSEYAAAIVTESADATTLLVPLQDKQQLHLTNGQFGWTISISSSESATVPVVLDATGMHPILHAAGAGRSVKILDPETGGVLLIGTVRDPRAAVQLGRATPLFNLLPTLAGVALEPLSDSVSLQSVAGGFSVEAQVPGLYLTHDAGDLFAQSDDASLTTAYAIPSQPPSTLFPVLRAQMTEAALAAPLARAPAQRAAALTMIALGLGSGSRRGTRTRNISKSQASRSAR